MQALYFGRTPTTPSTPTANHFQSVWGCSSGLRYTSLRRLVALRSRSAGRLESAGDSQARSICDRPCPMGGIRSRSSSDNRQDNGQSGAPVGQERTAGVRLAAERAAVRLTNSGGGDAVTANTDQCKRADEKSLVHDFDPQGENANIAVQRAMASPVSPSPPPRTVRRYLPRRDIARGRCAAHRRARR